MAENVNSKEIVEAIDFGSADQESPANNHSFLPMRRKMDRSLQQYLATKVKLDPPTP